MSMPDLSADAARRALAGLVQPDRDLAPDIYARAVWNVVAEPGDGAAGTLVAAEGPAEALRRVCSASDDEWDEARARWLPRLRPSAVQTSLDAARRAGARLVVPGDSLWPQRLDDLGMHAPLALWLLGGTDIDTSQTVAIVGARAATAYGEGVTADLSAELSGSGVSIVSGAAYGIDGAAHRAALSTGGTTIAFLAGGVDRAYPRGHEALLDRIARTGAVWSETPCGASPTKWRFLARKTWLCWLSGNHRPIHPPEHRPRRLRFHRTAGGRPTRSGRSPRAHGTPCVERRRERVQEERQAS